jgi:hypothetical protein
MKKKISKKDFSKLFNQKLSKTFVKEINKANLYYKKISKEKKVKLINKIVNIVNTDFLKAGQKYKKKWEMGWGENLKAAKSKFSKKSFIPGYSDKFKYARVGSELVQTCSKNFDHKILHLILLFCYLKFFKKFNNIIDFGCGTGHAILYLNKFNMNKKFIGLDWAQSSQDILKIINKKFPNISGLNFNFFKPKLKLKLNNWAAFTTASMEQIGKRYKKFYFFLKKNKPGVIVNIEPIPEMLNKNDLLESLSIQYMKKRNYLNSYLNFLLNEEKKKKIKILFKRKSYFGSFLIYGYSIIVWKFC